MPDNPNHYWCSKCAMNHYWHGRVYHRHSKHKGKEAIKACNKAKIDAIKREIKNSDIQTPNDIVRNLYNALGIVEAEFDEPPKKGCCGE